MYLVCHVVLIIYYNINYILHVICCFVNFFGEDYNEKHKSQVPKQQKIFILYRMQLESSKQ